MTEQQQPNEGDKKEKNIPLSVKNLGPASDVAWILTYIAIAVLPISKHLYVLQTCTNRYEWNRRLWFDRDIRAINLCIWEAIDRILNCTKNKQIAMWHILQQVFLWTSQVRA